MVAAIAIALTSSSRLQVQVFSIAFTPSRLNGHCLFLFSRRNSAVVLTLVLTFIHGNNLSSTHYVASK
jgi:hypothetical protein